MVALVCVPPIFCQGTENRWQFISYDNSGHATTLTDYLGIQQIRTSDLTRGVLLSRTDAANKTGFTRTTIYAWDARFRLPTSIVEPIVVNGTAGTRSTAIAYDDRANPLTKTVTPSSGEPARQWSYTYDALGLPASTTTPSGAVSQTTYNTQGQLTGWTDALGHAYTVDQYTQAGLPGRVTAPNGLQTLYAYDLRDRLLSVRRGTPTTHWESYAIAYQASGTGLVDHLTLQDGRRVAFAYNSAQWLTQTTLKDNQGQTLGWITYDYSLMGDPTGEHWFDAQGNTLSAATTTYDSFHRVATQVGAAGQTQTPGYDAQSRPLQVKDANGNLTKQTYDALGRVATMTDGLNHTTTLAYDPQDALVQVTDARGNATSYRYNGFGDLVGLTSPDRGTWSFQVDGAGRRTVVTDPRGATTSVVYDALDRPTSVVYDSTGIASSVAGLVRQSETQTFTYDTCAVARLCSAQDASGTTTYQYDLWGRVTQVSVTPAGSSGVTLTTGYGYDEAGRLVSTTYPSGRTLVRSYGAGGQVASLTWAGQPLLSQVTHAPVSGEVTGWQWPQAAAGGVSFTYDADRQLVSLADTSAQGSARTLGYDPGGRLTSVTVASHPDWNQGYAYDKADELTQATLGGYPSPLTYAYDAVGNRTSQTNGTTVWTSTITPTSNRLQGWLVTGGTTATVTYDAAGSVISDGQGMALAYDAKDRLAQTTTASATVSYAYNAQGQRAYKQASNGAGAGVERYAYDGAGRLLGVYGPDGTALEEYAYLDGWRTVALARNQGGSWTTYPVLSDQMGTPRQVLDPTSGNPVWQWEGKEPFGADRPNETVGGSTFVFRQRLPGQVFDSETGLVHNGARDYAPALGRYLQSDPTGLSAGWNTYSYVGGLPTGSIDPSGLRRILTVDSAIEGGHQPAYVAEYVRAMFYLNSNPEMAAVNQKVNDASYDVNIIITNSTDQKKLFEASQTASGFEIYFNPFLSPEFQNDANRTQAFVSPALALGHELDHTTCDRVNNVVRAGSQLMSGFLSLFGQGNPYSNMEEERVITGAERSLAEQEHELIRDNHRVMFDNHNLIFKMVPTSTTHPYVPK